MKRFLTLILALTIALSMCLFLTSCKNDDEKTDTQADDTQVADTQAEDITVTELSEQDVRILMEKNLDCVFLLLVSPLNHTTQQNSDGYYCTDGSYMQTYDELKDLVEDTYTADKAKELLNHPASDSPLYKNYDNKIYVKPDVITPIDYEIVWEDDYTIDMEKISDTEYLLTFETYDVNSNNYVTNGRIVFENEKWRFDDLVC